MPGLTQVDKALRPAGAPVSRSGPLSEVTAQLMLVGMALVLLGALLFIVGLVGWALLGGVTAG